MCLFVCLFVAWLCLLLFVVVVAAVVVAVVVVVVVVAVVAAVVSLGIRLVARLAVLIGVCVVFLLQPCPSKSSLVDPHVCSVYAACLYESISFYGRLLVFSFLNARAAQYYFFILCMLSDKQTNKQTNLGFVTFPVRVPCHAKARTD